MIRYREVVLHPTVSELVPFAVPDALLNPTLFDNCAGLFNQAISGRHAHPFCTRISAQIRLITSSIWAENCSCGFEASLLLGGRI